MSSPNVYESCIDALDVLDSGLATQDQLLRAKDLVTALGEAHRALKERVDAGLVKHIQAHGEITIGPKRFWVGTVKERKCRSVRATIAAITELSGGNPDALVDCLSTNCFKDGATMKFLGDRALEFFEVKDKPKLNSAGETVPSLNVADERFQ